MNQVKYRAMPTNAERIANHGNRSSISENGPRVPDLLTVQSGMKEFNLQEARCWFSSHKLQLQ